MLEPTIITYLSGLLSVPVSTQEPESADSFVLVRRLGEIEENMISTVTLAFKCYAATEYEAATLEDTVKTAIKAATDLDAVMGVSLVASYSNTDLTEKRYMYQCNYEITYII